MNYLNGTPYNNTLSPPLSALQYDAIEITASLLIQEIFLGLISILGVIGNCMVCYTVVKRAQVKHSTWYFLCCLSISDAFVCLVNIPILMYATYDESVIDNGTFLCQFNGFCLVCFFLVSVLTLSGISLHKYYYIRRPLHLRASTKSLRIIGFIWFVSIGIALGPLVGWSQYSHVHGHKQCVPASIRPATNIDFSYLGVLLLVGFFIPLISMVYCYTAIFIETLSHHKRLNSTSIRGDTTFDRRKRAAGRTGRRGSVTYDWGILKTVFIVVTTFIVCWAPFVVYICYNFTQNLTPSMTLSQVAFMLAYAQSILNPVIYALRHDLFRTQFKSVICCIKYMNVDIRSERSGSGSHPGSLFLVDGMSRSTSSSSSSSDSTLVFYQRKDSTFSRKPNSYAPKLDSITERSMPALPSYDNEVFQLNAE
ncbi:melanopsin-like [Clytia hemisphaerica]|uniref:G-protein coupled receptors family 1 profile domain-containing protein n=1 Tax=Clytia hemisphaerica TaxID=252671 RepID=A0A7M5X8Y8_9CNID